MNAPIRTGAAPKDDNIKPLISDGQLAADYPHLVLAVEEIEKLGAELPPVLEDDEDLAIISWLVPRANADSKRIEKQRVETGRPFLDATSDLNGWFKALSARIDAVKVKAEKIGKTYLDKKAADERKRRDAEAAEATRKANEAAVILAAAVKTGDVEQVQVAAVTADTLKSAAGRATAAVDVKPADLARTSVGGATSTLVENWTFEIEDINRLDLEALRPFFTTTAFEQALRGYVKAGRRQIAGARIYSDTRFSTR